MASSSLVRARLLSNAGLTFSVRSPEVDERSFRESFRESGMTAAQAAQALAETKAFQVCSAGKQNVKLVVCCRTRCWKSMDVGSPNPRVRRMQKEQNSAPAGKKRISCKTAVCVFSTDPPWRLWGNMHVASRMDHASAFGGRAGLVSRAFFRRSRNSWWVPIGKGRGTSFFPLTKETFSPFWDFLFLPLLAFLRERGQVR